MSSVKDSSLSDAGLQQLRHDLINPLNVLAGATAALGESDLSDAQRAWVRLLTSTADRLRAIVDDIERYDQAPMIEGRARLADLLSIAAARVAKPFDRQRLIRTIEEVGGRRPLRILLVDDSPELGLLVRTYLQSTSWELDIVETGERAVSQATTERYDVVLMDIDLPGLDGATAAHAIRASELARGASPTPIVAMTAFDTPAPPIASHATPVQAAPPSRRDAQAEGCFESTSAAGVARGLTQTDEPEVDEGLAAIPDPEIAPLVPRFLENRRTDVRIFREALAAGEFAIIQSAAHNMKGTGRSYGFTTISRIGSELESAARHKDVDRATMLIERLDAYLRRVRIEEVK